jgi:hypothetical protein
LEKVEGFISKIEGLGPIYNWISNYRGLGVKSIKELDCGLVSGNVRGLISKCEGKLIIGSIIFLKKTMWTESTERWTGLRVAHRGPAAWTAQSFTGAWPSAAPCAGALPRQSEKGALRCSLMVRFGGGVSRRGRQWSNVVVAGGVQRGCFGLPMVV